VRSAERIVEIGSVLPENEETRCRLHHTATPFFVPPFHHNHGTDFHNYFCTTHCKIAYYIDIWLYMCKFRAGNSSRACTLSNEAFPTNEFQSEVFFAYKLHCAIGINDYIPNLLKLLESNAWSLRYGLNKFQPRKMQNLIDSHDSKLLRK